MKKVKTFGLKVPVIMIFFVLFWVTLAVGKEQLPDYLLKKIEQMFPDAKIVEVEEERYKGKVVTEVELIARNGKPYEVYLSKEGKIVKVEEEDDDFSWFK